MISHRLCLLTLCIAAAGIVCRVPRSVAADISGGDAWRPLFNGTNLDGWYIVLRNAKSDDPDHLVEIHDGAIHMYKGAPEGSQQPHGYISTDKEYSHYHLRLEYKWGTKRFGSRSHARRDAGVLYHVVGKDGVWPRSVECQIQENDVGDIFTVYTRLTATVDPRTTNLVSNVATNDAGVVRTNQSIQPIFLETDKGGAPLVQGVAGGIRRVIRNPMNEHEGWNTVEVIVHGDKAAYIVNGKTNNQASDIQQMIDNQWTPLQQGRIALQLESAEILYRNVQIRELQK